MVLGLLVLGCSGSSGGGTAPETPVTRETPTPAPEREEEPVVGNPLPPPQMVERMIATRVLEHPQVAPYLHQEIPANVPLAVHPVPELAQGMPQVRAGGQVVRVVATPAEARFVFTGYERTPGTSRVRVRFEIPSEGVSGHVDLELRDYVWEYVDASVVER